MVPSPDSGLLLVCATEPEARGLFAKFSWDRKGAGLHQATGFPRLHLLITGIGMVNTAFHLGRNLENLQPALAVNFGIAGSFDPKIEPGAMVEIIADCYAELGADSPQGFMDLHQLGFPAFELGGIPQYNRLFNPNPSQENLLKAEGITVSTISGEPTGILRRKQIWHPQVETMESAAFFQCCLEMKIPFHAFRAISNRVEPRNRSNWKINEALENLHHFLHGFISRFK